MTPDDCSCSSFSVQLLKNIMQVTHIDIPLKGSTKGEVIGVGMDELPEQAADILDILKEEEATRFLYLRFAVI